MSNTFAKKVFVVGLAASTVLMGLAPLAASAAAHAAGTNVMSSDGTVWMVMPDGTRRAYTSAGAFLSYGFNSWSTVVVANADDLALTAGGFIPPQDGSITCSDRGADKGTCYLITGSQKAGFTSAAVFTGRGFSFSNAQMGDVSWMGSYSALINDTTSANLPGVLVNNNGTVQLVGTTGLLGIPDLATFNGWGYSFSKVVPANAADKAMVQTGVMAARTPGQLSPTATTGTTPPPPVGGGLSVSLASNNPAAAVIADGTANNPVLRVNLTAGSAPVSVTGLKFTKGGFTANTNITGAGVYVNGVRHGNVISTLGADGVAVTTFGSSPITVPAGSSVVVEFRINLGTSANSGTLSFGINAAADITSNASSVSGSFPVSGNTFTTVDGASSLGAVTLDVQAVNTGGASYNVDAASSQRITKFRVVETTSVEAVKLYSLTLWNNGTAADGDLKDIELRDQTGNVLATAQQVGKMVVFNLATPYLVEKGQTKDFEVYAKIVNGAARTIQFTVYNDYDLYVVGQNTLSGILPTAAGGVDSSFPVGDTTTTYNTVTIGSGTLVFNRSTDSPSSAMVPGSTDQILAKYDLTSQGEDMEIRGLSFGIATGAATQQVTGTVYVKVDGAIVFSAAHNTTNFSAIAGAAAARTLSSYPIIKAGVKSVVEIIGSVHSTAVASASLMVNEFDVTSVKRLVTNDITDPTVAPLDGLTRSITAAALTVRTLATPVATTIVPVATSQELANLELDASASGEDVRVSSLVVTDTTSSTASVSGIANLQLYKKNADGTLTLIQTSSSTATISTTAGTVTFNFSTPLTVSKTALTTLVLKGDVLSGGAGQTHTFLVANTASHVTSSGATTGTSISAPTIAGSGQAMTIGSGGTLTGSVLTGTGATPSVAQVVSIGTQDGTYFAFRLNAQYEQEKITSLTIRATGTSMHQNTVRNLELWRKVGTVMDATPFATASQFGTCASNACSNTWTSTDNLLPAAISPGSPVEIYVKADIGGEGTSYLGDDFGFSLNMASGADITAAGVNTGAAPTYAGGFLNLSGATTVKSTVVPFSVVVSGVTPAQGTSITSSMAAGTNIGRFKIQNNGSAQVTITAATFSDSGTNTSSDDRYRMTVTAQGSSAGTDVTASSTALTVAFGTLTNSFTLDGGAYRYIDITVPTVTNLASGDSWQLSVSALGQLLFSVAESALGYDGEQDGDFTGTITGLYVDGKPSLGTISKQ